MPLLQRTTIVPDLGAPIGVAVNKPSRPATSAEGGVPIFENPLPCCTAKPANPDSPTPRPLSTRPWSAALIYRTHLTFGSRIRINFRYVGLRTGRFPQNSHVRPTRAQTVPHTHLPHHIHPSWCVVHPNERQ